MYACVVVRLTFRKCVVRFKKHVCDGEITSFFNWDTSNSFFFANTRQKMHVYFSKINKTNVHGSSHES